MAKQTLLIRRNLRQRVKLGTVALLWLATCGFGCTALADEPLTSVADLRYGVSLYHYYQNENLQALSELMVAAERGGIQGHGDNPEIMEGGFSMAYGMEGKAAEIFQRLLDANRPKKTRDAAWYYLAMMRYEKRDWEGAEAILSHVSDDPDKTLASHLNLLQFNLDLRQERVDEAHKRIEQVPKSDPSWPYMQFNLGSAYSRTQRYDQGVLAFTSLLEMEQRHREHLNLYDKAMTAAGYGYLLQQQFDQAIEHFKQVRMDSHFSNRALLGYGWAAVEKEDYALALKPWQALSRRSLIDENTQEVLVAIPYAYEKMGYQGAALRAFQFAESSYLEEIAKLDDVIGNVQGYAIREALNIERSQDFDWLSYAEKNQLSPQLSYLIPLFSQQTFVRSVQELRDLLAIQVQFQEWQEKLAFYSDMLDEREQNRVLEMDYLERQQVGEKIAALEQKRDHLAETLARIGREHDVAALVSPEEQPKMDRILRAERNAQLLLGSAREYGLEVMPAEELQQLAETVRRQKGFLMWQTAELFDERYWRIKQGLAQLNDELAHMRATQRRIGNIVEQGFDLEPYRRRIGEADLKLLNQLVNVERAIEASQDQMRERVLLVLEQQRDRLYHYLAQSRLSIARLLDQASEARQSPVQGQSDSTETLEITPEDAERGVP